MRTILVQHPHAAVCVAEGDQVLAEKPHAFGLTVSLWFVLTTTDGLDGWLARRDGTTRSGAFLDPLADKFLVLGGFFALGINGDFSWAAVVIVTAREVGVSTYRSYMARRGVSLPARKLGKWKISVSRAPGNAPSRAIASGSCGRGTTCRIAPVSAMLKNGSNVPSANATTATCA